MARLAAGVRKRPNGTFEKRFTIAGKRYSVYATTAAEIAEKEMQMREQIQKDLYKSNKNITLDDYFTEWIEARKPSVKETTIRTYTSIYDGHIKPTLGNIKIQKIEKRQIQQLQKQWLESLSVVSANSALNELKMILTDAVRDEIITANPAANVKKVRNKGKKATETYHRALTHEEQAAFMNEVQSEYHAGMIAFLLHSGLRFGEAAALEWPDVDYKAGVIHITKTLTIAANGKIKTGPTKTKAGKRDVPLTNDLKSILAKQRNRSNILSFTNRNVFLSETGKTVKNSVINRTIHRTLKRLDAKGIHIEHFTAHALRDTFATRYIEAGGTPQVLKRIMGHESYSMTMDLYSHVLEDTVKQEMNQIDISV